MIFDEPNKKVWLYTKPTDMRKSFDGLQMKRLELGQFRTPSGEQISKELTWIELKLILEGIEIEKARYSKRWKYSKVA